ncbi:isopentenyl-diphosphate Delta-isomerase [Microlunatus ginsengisoli]|uniref:Isopentenyl-diphosphate Delta-isomerase n=1 Tax=Microlunatus ginsengisoli TaxID=363863 RepID=A0ABP6ZGX9_9ACTN
MRNEQVVLLDRDGSVIGQSPKADVHHARTPLHLAFSVHIFDPSGRVLLTRRALAKKTWPGVWTNSCCGHPGVGEPMGDAITRRVRHELGLELTGLRSVLPDFAYTATDASGVVENEICPVFAAEAVHPKAILGTNPEEVMDYAWVDWSEAVAAMAATPFAFSPWSVEQVALIGARRP